MMQAGRRGCGVVHTARSPIQSKQVVSGTQPGAPIQSRRVVAAHGPVPRPPRKGGVRGGFKETALAIPGHNAPQAIRRDVSRLTTFVEKPQVASFDRTKQCSSGMSRDANYRESSEVRYATARCCASSGMPAGAVRRSVAGCCLRFFTKSVSQHPSRMIAIGASGRGWPAQPFESPPAPFRKGGGGAVCR